MIKKLESEMLSIAHRILKLKGKEDVDKLHKEVAVLYEKLTVLKFANENFEDDKPTIGNDSSFFDMLDVAFNNKFSDTVEIENQTYVNVDEREDDVAEPLMEKIKDMVAQMPQETQQVDDLLAAVNPTKQYAKNDFEEITAGFDNIPEFEPVDKNKDDKKKSLNDSLKNKTLSIGLNDKLAFVKHLFDGKNEDYDRVLSQLNTSANYEEAKHLIENIIKPDYNNWLGKEEYQERFMEIIEARFN